MAEESVTVAAEFDDEELYAKVDKKKAGEEGGSEDEAGPDNETGTTTAVISEVKGEEPDENFKDKGDHSAESDSDAGSTKAPDSPVAARGSDPLYETVADVITHNAPDDDDDEDKEPEAPEVPDSEPPVEPPSYNDVQDDDRDADDDRPSSEPDHEPEITPAVDVSSHGYHPRLCVIRKWPDFQGYGFNLHAEKDKPGQYIGLVDANSPAEDADLRKGDRIIEVNGENIEESTHQQVIQKIKAGGDETTMLVVDSDADEYYKNNGIRVSSSLPEVIKNETTPREAPAMTGHSFTPRLCHITKWPDFQGYGFNLHAEKERGGQYIGKIDDNSPAQDGGLRENDRIIEVNGVNVESETHGQVISRIKAGGDETKLLVVDREADSYYKSKGITVTSSMPEVKSLATTKRTPRTAVVTNGESSQTASISTPKRTQSKRHAPSPPSSPISPDEMFSMSAAEMRSHIQRHHSDKRVDRHSTHNIRDKVRLFQQL